VRRPFQLCSIAFVLTAVAAPAMISCAHRGVATAFTPEIVRPDLAVVYVFRHDRPARSRPVQVFINQAPAGELRPGEYMALPVEPGESLVRVEADSSAARPVVLRAGEAAYMMILMPGLGPAKPTLEVPDSESARPLIARTVRAAADS
jgi:hypothetical protein